jgi:uncharacterized coiled-coil protein SlyX
MRMVMYFYVHKFKFCFDKLFNLCASNKELEVRTMRILQTVLSVLLMTVFAGQISAQSLSKAEKKRLKKEIKAYKKDPASYKKMMDRNRTTIQEQEEVITELTNQLDEQNKKIAALNDSLRSIRGRYEALMQKPSCTEVPKGTVYAVQIGYFKELDLKAFNADPRMAKAEVIDGAKRYVIGYFKNPQDALNFRSDIQKLGISDAFVSQYVNGTRNKEYDALKE